MVLSKALRMKSGFTDRKVAPQLHKRPELAYNIQNLAILEINITTFTYLLSNDGFDSFSRRLNLVLAPNRTNEGLKKQYEIPNTQ